MDSVRLYLPDASPSRSRRQWRAWLEASSAPLHRSHVQSRRGRRRWWGAQADRVACTAAGQRPLSVASTMSPEGRCLASSVGDAVDAAGRRIAWPPRGRLESRATAYAVLARRRTGRRSCRKQPIKRTAVAPVRITVVRSEARRRDVMRPRNKCIRHDRPNRPRGA